MLLPSIVVNDFEGQKTFFGFEAVLAGSIMFLGGGFPEWCIWLANPLFIFAAFFVEGGSVLEILMGTVGLLLSLSFLSFR